jgi:cysteine desulfurase / selenocysteine lyase
MNLTEFRAQFPILQDRAFLFSGAMAPAAAPVRARWDAWADSWSDDPNSVLDLDAMIWQMSVLREAFSNMIGADAGEIALTDNTSRAANIAIRILEARDGNVVVDDSTYWSSVYPWRAHGREVRYVATEDSADAAATIARAVDKDTVAVCVSHVAPFSGHRHDLTELASVAHSRGALLLVDAAQSTGVIPINVHEMGIDFLVTTGMKWLLGPPGIGFMYASHEVLAQAPLLDIGYIGLEGGPADWPVTQLPPVSPNARRYELGLPSLPAVAASSSGIELLLAVGLEQISAHVERLVTRCINGLIDLGQDVITPLDPGKRAGVIVIRSQQAAELFDVCRRQRVDIGTVVGGVRVDPHGFNNEQDIDRFLHCYKVLSSDTQS